MCIIEKECEGSAVIAYFGDGVSFLAGEWLYWCGVCNNTRPIPESLLNEFLRRLAILRELEEKRK